MSEQSPIPPEESKSEPGGPKVKPPRGIGPPDPPHVWITSSDIRGYCLIRMNASAVLVLVANLMVSLGNPANSGPSFFVARDLARMFIKWVLIDGTLGLDPGFVSELRRLNLLAPAIPNSPQPAESQ